VTAVKPMNHTEFSKAIDALGLTQVGTARFIGVDPRTCRRYVAGELPLPPAAAMLLRVMLAHGLAPDDVGKLDGRPKLGCTECERRRKQTRDRVARSRRNKESLSANG
jgi:hypothetical protein